MKNIIKKIIKIILNSYFLYKYFLYYPLIYTSKFIPLDFKKKVTEKNSKIFIEICNNISLNIKIRILTDI